MILIDSGTATTFDVVGADGGFEGGVIAPVNLKLGKLVTLTTGPEVDVLRNARDDGRHLATAQLVNIAFALPASLTLYGEVWGDWNFDPAGTVRQSSFDTALTWGVSSLLQLDIGANIGLNRSTPGVQAYVGVSQKF